MLISDKDGIGGLQYPVSFEKPTISDNSIRYAIVTGDTTSGMNFEQLGLTGAV
jgi:hypothetical protein